MYTIIKKFSIILGLSVLSAASYAQRHELGFSAGAGYGSLRYKVSGESSKHEPTTNFGLTYTWLCSGGWGLHTGLQMDFFRSETALPGNTTYTSYAVDRENEGFEYRVQQKDYAEKQRLNTFSIPVMLQWQTTSKSNTRFYAQAGGRLLMPVQRNFEASADEITTTNYYPSVNAELSNLPEYGFGTTQNWQHQSKFNLKHSIVLAAESGAKFSIGKQRSLYTGAYLDYGLTNMRENNAIAPYQYGSLGFESTSVTSLLNRSEVEGKIRMISYGIRLQYALNIARN